MTDPKVKQHFVGPVPTNNHQVLPGPKRATKGDNSLYDNVTKSSAAGKSLADALATEPSAAMEGVRSSLADALAGQQAEKAAKGGTTQNLKTKLKPTITILYQNGETKNIPEREYEEESVPAEGRTINLYELPDDVQMPDEQQAPKEGQTVKTIYPTAEYKPLEPQPLKEIGTFNTDVADTVPKLNQKFEYEDDPSLIIKHPGKLAEEVKEEGKEEKTFDSSTIPPYRPSYSGGTYRDVEFEGALESFRKENNEDTIKDLTENLSFGENGEIYLQYYDNEEKCNKITQAQVSSNFVEAVKKQLNQIEELGAKDKITNMSKVIEKAFAGWADTSLDNVESLYLVARAAQADKKIGNKFGNSPFDVNKETQKLIIDKIFGPKPEPAN